ncbi:MAG: serpin family protein [Planctomycetota bacterium]|nr:serpin family protein [Planctomycetota bacterium]
MSQARLKCVVAMVLVLSVVGVALAAGRPATQPGATMADPEAIAIGRGINQFAFDLYAQLAAEKGNLFYSPQSISTALAMTWAGARGETAAQMAKTLRLPADRVEKPGSIHAAYAKLLAGLSAAREKQGYELSAANALWGQKGYAWLPGFLGVVKTNYGAGLEEVDFVKNAEGARQTINAWVEKETREKIKDLIPQGVLDGLTRLVLTNAIYFKGDWDHAFKKDRTKDEDFFAEGGRKVKAPMMNQSEHFGYMDGGEFQALEMPYKGDALSMVILLPKKEDGLAALEKTLSAETVAGWLAKLARREVYVTVPKFKTTAQFMLADTLKAIGMPLAFDPGKADFSGMDGKKDLFISAVIHKAFVDVSEEGTEAAAATAAVAPSAPAPPSEPPPVFRADHPFIFLIRDKRSGCILFLGRVVNPKE